MATRIHMAYGVLVPLVAAAVCGASAALAQVSEGFSGQEFAERYCAGCHAVGASGASPLAAAPPFRTLHRHYPVENLAEALAEGIITGHPEMPRFQIRPREIDAFIAYLRTLE